MAQNGNDWTEILIRRGIVSPDQLAEADQMSRESGFPLADAFVKLGYAAGEDVMRAMAQFHNMDYIDLSEVTDRKSGV